MESVDQYVQEKKRSALKIQKKKKVVPRYSIYFPEGVKKLKPLGMMFTFLKRMKFYRWYLRIEE
jgi:hypothetical protein